MPQDPRVIHISCQAPPAPPTELFSEPYLPLGGAARHAMVPIRVSASRAAHPAMKAATHADRDTVPVRAPAPPPCPGAAAGNHARAGPVASPLPTTMGGVAAAVSHAGTAPSPAAARTAAAAATAAAA